MIASPSGAARPSAIPHVAVIVRGAEVESRSMQALSETVGAARAAGIGVVTIFGFSALQLANARECLLEISAGGVRFALAGRWADVPSEQRAALSEVAAANGGRGRFVVRLAIDYSGRADISNAVKALARDVRVGRLSPDAIDEETLGSYLKTSSVPDPDLMICTGGALRLDDAYLYQLAYTELWRSDLSWDDFTAAEFRRALDDFAMRQRRFGQ